MVKIFFLAVTLTDHFCMILLALDNNSNRVDAFGLRCLCMAFISHNASLTLPLSLYFSTGNTLLISCCITY